MEQETPKEFEPATASTQSLWVHGRSQWNEPDASLSFDWSGTQVGFRVLGSAAEVNMLASIGEDMLAVYADGRFVRKIGPGNGRKETFLLVCDAPEDCTVRIVKLSEPNMSIPITIYDVWTSPSSQQDGVAPSIGPFNVEGCHPVLEPTFECVGDSDTSALYNVAIGNSVTSLDSDIKQGWPFYLTESLGVADPLVVALSGVGVLAGPYRPESLSDYYPRLLCCQRNSQNNSAPRRHNIDSSAGSPEGGPLCILVFVGGNDFVTMPRDSPSAQSSFLRDFVSAHQALLRAIRQQRPKSPIVSLYGDADSCSGCHSVDEQKFISSNMQRAVLESVAGLGGAPHGFYSCLVQPNIRPQCHSDWKHDMHWSPTAHEKFAVGAKTALRALALREGVQRKGEPQFPGMDTLAAVLSLSQSPSGAASADAALSESVSAQDAPDESTPHSVQDGGVWALQTAGVRPQSSWSALHFRAMEGDAEVTALLVEDERCLVAVDSAVMTRGGRTFRRVTPLYLAALAGHLSVTRALLGSQAFAPFVNTFAEKEVDSTRRRDLWSALHAAAKRGHVGVAECLLHSESFSKDIVNAVTGNGCTALHLACSAGNEEVVQLLLDEDRFTAVNAAMARDSDTALTIAIKRGHESTACRLLRHSRFHALDAVVVARGHRLHALQLLARHGMEEGLRLFLDVHARRNPAAFVRLGAVWAAAEANHDRIVHVLTTHAAVDTAAEIAYTQLEDQYGSTCNALHQACWLGHQSVVQCILRLNGCESGINAHNGKDQRTALHIAALNRHEDIALCLLRSDAFTAVNALDCDQCTALHNSCYVKLERLAIEIIQHPMFTRHAHSCCNGGTALFLAEELKLPSVIAALGKLGFAS